MFPGATRWVALSAQGSGFLWSDRACYSLGVGLRAAIEIMDGIVRGKDRS